MAIIFMDKEKARIKQAKFDMLADKVANDIKTLTGEQDIMASDLRDYKIRLNSIDRHMPNIERRITNLENMGADVEDLASLRDDLMILVREQDSKITKLLEMVTDIIKDNTKGKDKK